MEIEGYAVRYCTRPGCSHRSDGGNCTNPEDTKYYVDPRVGLRDICGVRLVVAHDDGHVVGRCTFEDSSDGRGIFVRCEMDDAYLFEAMSRRYDIYKEKYNSDIPSPETLWKKIMTSFSLAHNPDTGVVRHVSLVDSPGRVGTAVSYARRPEILLKRRPENLYISDLVSSQSTAAQNASDRNQYLWRNTLYSHRPNDTVYLTASRNTMSRHHQSDFDCGIFSQRLREFIDREERRQTNRGRRAREYVHDSGDEDGMSPSSSSKRQRVEASRDNEQQPQQTAQNNNNEALMKVMMEGFKQMQETMTAAMTAKAATQPPPPAAVAVPPPPQVAVEPVVPQVAAAVAPTHTPMMVDVEASRPKAAIHFSLDGPALERVVQLITSQDK